MINAIAVLAALGDHRRPDPDDDDVLVARHHAGDTTAFEAMYRGHAVAVYRRLSRILGPIAEREDLMQDVFVALHRALPGFRGEARLSTLIHRIAINRACEYLRVSARRPATPIDTAGFDDFVSPCRSPADHAIARAELVHVFACLARIKPKKRIAFLLRVVEGLSFEEIAVLVDATPEAVAKRFQHGQKELDALLARADRSPS
ncbi:MAG: RNA polymerase sigma factor [Kofleriaceae bacterium]